jgi:hypothetical protein
VKGEAVIRRCTTRAANWRRQLRHRPPTPTEPGWSSESSFFAETSLPCPVRRMKTMFTISRTSMNKMLLVLPSLLLHYHRNCPTI